MRGKAPVPTEIMNRIGITPAYAGKSCLPQTDGKHCKDHPRLCGEKYTAARKGVPMTGSPPPMRGKGYSDGNLYGMYRITPAYAGKSNDRCNFRHSNKDHPRLCGEKLFLPIDHILTTGSPPPMRGKGCFDTSIPFILRITPAYAGKRSFALPIRRARWDHPRLCGEKALGSKIAAGATGSPPPMRGKEFRKWSQKQPCKDHPRLCGEKGGVYVGELSAAGSPPPMRGKVVMPL